MKSYILSGIATVCFAIVFIFFLCGYEFSRFNIFFIILVAIAGNFNAFISEYRKENP